MLLLCAHSNKGQTIAIKQGFCIMFAELLKGANQNHQKKLKQNKKKPHINQVK